MQAKPTSLFYSQRSTILGKSYLLIPEHLLSYVIDLDNEGFNLGALEIDQQSFKFIRTKS